MKKAQSTCRFSGASPLTADKIMALGGFPDRLAEDPEMIASIAKAIQKTEGRNFVILPFCGTVEAKALGADILPWNEQAGPRPGKYTLFNLKEMKEADIVRGVQAKALFRACSLLKKQEIRIVYELSGPISILNCLMDLTVLFKQWRKEPELMQRVFAMFQRMLLDYLREICDAGADVISFADPAGNPAILGPRFSRTLRAWFLYPFLEEALIICSGSNKPLMICPALAAGFEEEIPAGKERIRVCCIGNAKRIEVDEC